MDEESCAPQGEYVSKPGKAVVVLVADVDSLPPLITVVIVVENVLVPSDPELVVNTTVVAVVGVGVGVDRGIEGVTDVEVGPPVPSSRDVVVIG